MPRGDPEYLLPQALRSREALEVERIDLWQIHRIDPRVPRDVLWRRIELKLFAHAGASSMSVHILLREVGLPFKIEMGDVKAKVRPDGSGYGAVAGRGLVPLLQLADGATIAENTVLAQFICDATGRADLMPPHGSVERYRVMEWQSWVASELDKVFTPCSAASAKARRWRSAPTSSGGFQTWTRTR